MNHIPQADSPRPENALVRKRGAQPHTLLSLFACKFVGSAYFAIMNSKQKKTLSAVFIDPVSGTIAWDDIESLLIGVGCRVIEGSGSRVRFVSGNEAEFFHRPHPDKEAKRYQVRAARDFLKRLGVTP